MKKQSVLEKMSESASFAGGMVLFVGCALVNKAIQNTKKLYYEIRKIPYCDSGAIFSSYERKKV